jgi:hypothetical protein
MVVPLAPRYSTLTSLTKIMLISLTVDNFKPCVNSEGPWPPGFFSASILSFHIANLYKRSADNFLDFQLSEDPLG